jgi:hypothetical protein
VSFREGGALRRGLLGLGLALWATAAGGAPDPLADVMQQTPEQLEKGIESQHPAVYFVLARKLFEAGRKDDAVFWYYAGQLRYRYHLKAAPGLDPSGDPALFGSLSEVIGRPINEWAFGDLDALRATLDRVLAWDDRSPNGFTPKDRHRAALDQTRAGLRGLVEHIRDNAESIRRQRAANGLENRR